MRNLTLPLNRLALAEALHLPTISNIRARYVGKNKQCKVTYTFRDDDEAARFEATWA